MQSAYKSVHTFDDVNNVLTLADKCSINGTLNSQLLFHRLGVTLQVCVGLADFVKVQVVVLKGKEIHECCGF